MFLKSTKTQTIFLLKQKNSIFTFYIFLSMVLLNFVGNVLAFQGMDMVEMYHPMKLLLLSYNKLKYSAGYLLLLIQLYPLLVVCPAGFSLAVEEQAGENAYMITRLGHLNYKLSKLLSAFFATSIVVTLPFLIEIALNYISFPLGATGDFIGWGHYSQEYIESVQNYFMPGLYLYSPYIYAIVGTLFFGLVSGVLGAFTVGFSSIFRVKYRIYLFLPVFLLLNSTAYFNILSKFSGSTTPLMWGDYFLLFNDYRKSIILLGVFVLSMIILSFLATFISSKKECL